MRSAALLSLLAVSSAAAQGWTDDSFVSFDWQWQESDAVGAPVASPNGIVEPGESVRFSLGVSFTNQYGIATYVGGGPPPGFGTIMGLHAGYVDLMGFGGATGQWNLDSSLGLGTHPDWEGDEKYWFSGTPQSGGTLVHFIQFFQLPSSVSTVLTTNPVDRMWQGVWTPSNYTPRSVSFEGRTTPNVAGPPFAVLLLRTPTSLTFAWCQGSNGQAMSIPIVPAPAASIVLLMLAAARGLHRTRR